MKFNDDIIQHLTGEKFSSGLNVKISNPEKFIINRIDFIIQHIKNKHVLHLGCCDHLPIITHKIRSDQWLHKHITDASSICLGIDVNSEAIDYVMTHFNYSNIVHGDITGADNIPQLIDSKFDVMVMGEILEHVNNPVAFLKKIRKRYLTNIRQIVITVPNAFSYSNIMHAKNHLEHINSDHRFFFTPYTLAKVVTEAGYSIEGFYFADNIEPPGKNYLKLMSYLRQRFIYEVKLRRPAFRDTLIMIIK